VTACSSLSPGRPFGFARPGSRVRVATVSTFPHIKPWGAQRTNELLGPCENRSC
jgi:hypothetical protein